MAILFRMWRDTTMVKDPVCGMQVNEHASAGKTDYQGNAWKLVPAGTWLITTT